MVAATHLMTSADVARLPLKRIEAALRKTTETLAAELGAPTASTPDWSEFEWCIAQAAAAIHGVSPLLAGTLRWRGPESWQRFLSEQREHTFKRHQRIAQLLADIGSQAVRNGIALVPLKGAALHEIGIYQPGERPMSDIDLLVSSAEMQATARLLATLDYRESYVSWKHRVFETGSTPDTVGFGEHVRNPIKVEVHTRLAERLPVLEHDVSHLVIPSRPSAGLNSYPSMAALMIHLLMHAAGNMCFNGLRLLHLHDIASLSRWMTRGDWEAFLALGKDQMRWLSPPLMLVARYYRTALPTYVTDRARAECSWLLRRSRTLSDVSLANLWIQAFPGLPWAQSVSESFGYIKSRIVPDREALSLRSEHIKGNLLATQFSWSHLPRWQRVVRWIFQRPPRVETLSPVWAALAHHPELTHSSERSL